MLSAAACSSPSTHTPHVTPVNNSYAVGLERGVREQAATTPSHRTPNGRAGCPAGPTMHPKTMRQQNGNQQATSLRKQTQRAQTRPTMTTEYQERFLPPRSHMTAVSIFTQKGPYHPLKATGAEATTFRTYCVTQKWIKTPPKTPQPPKGQCSSAPKDPAHCGTNKMTSEVEDFTSVYKNDFQAWKIDKRQPHKLKDSLKVKQGLAAIDSASKDRRSQKSSAEVAANSKAVPEEQEPIPFESITSYRSDYVTHPVQPGTHRVKPVFKTNKGFLSEPAVSRRPKVTRDINQELSEQVTEFFQKIRTWSLETKFSEQGKAKESSPPADLKLLSTTHAHYTAHKCQRNKPILPTMKTCDDSKQPFQATTSMKEDYKAWNTPRRLPIVPKKETDCSVSACMHWPAESHNTNPKPFSLHPKLNKTAAVNSSYDATEEPQRPAENSMVSGFEYTSTVTEDSRRCWATSLDKGVTWPDGDISEEPPEAHQIITCMVSGRT